MEVSNRPDGFAVAQAFRRILRDASRRGTLSLDRFSHLFVANLLARLPLAARADYTSLDNLTDPNYYGFVPQPSDSITVRADVLNFLGHTLDYGAWVHRAQVIRHSGDKAHCIGNLSVALGGLGPAYNSGSQGAAALLTILPTASALVGAPAKELWLLSKVCPLAGFLSSILSLGGNIIPDEITDSDSPGKKETPKLDESVLHLTDPELFAIQVAERARQLDGRFPTASIYGAMASQLVLVGAILGGCYFLSAGTLISWWCDAGYWMFYWYAFVCLGSIIENFAGVPFTETHMMRVWPAPKILIGEDAPWVLRPSTAGDGVRSSIKNSPTTGSLPARTSLPRKPLPGKGGVSVQQNASNRSASDLQFYPQPAYDKMDILAGLKKGYRPVGGIQLDPSEPSTRANEAFNVFVSVRGVSTAHAILRIFSKLFSIGVFAVGTAMFSSAALVTIMVGMVTLIIVLVSSVFGRIIAMYMADKLTRDEPVLYKVVNSRAEVCPYIEAILQQPDLACEVESHIVVQGRCIKRFRKGFRMSHIFGVLVAPFDISRLATSGTSPEK